MATSKDSRSEEAFAALMNVKLQDTRVYQEAVEERRKEEARSLILKLLNRRLSSIPDALLSQVQALSLEQLEALGEALLDFSTLADLEGWLQD
jgi:predicted transposase YdaD